MGNLVLDVGLAAKLKVAFDRNGWTADEIDKICVGNQLGKYREVILGRASIVALDSAQALKEIPKPKPAAEKPLLLRVGEPRIVASVESFVVADTFREGKTTDGVKIWSLGSNFKTYALPHIERDVHEGLLVTDHLERNSLDEQIMAAAGEDFKNSLAHFFDHLKTASHDNWYFSYVEINGVLWGVDALWYNGILADGWGVELFQVPYPRGWDARRVLVSRKPSVA